MKLSGSREVFLAASIEAKEERPPSAERPRTARRQLMVKVFFAADASFRKISTLYAPLGQGVFLLT